MGKVDSDHSRRSELGRFLRTKREALPPDQANTGLRRRRTPGLLREEVAELAGTSLTWYTWMEQARPTRPSLRVLDGLAKALRLEPVERQHLMRLARPDLEVGHGSGVTTELPRPLEAFIEGLAPHPAYALNGRWDVIAWNRPAELVFGDFAACAPSQRNVLHRLLFDPQWRALFADWDVVVARTVAQFRAAMARHANEPWLHDFTAMLCAESPLFQALWSRRQVAPSPSLLKTLRHPRLGALNLHYATFWPASAPDDVRLTIYTPADAATQAIVRRMQ
jgi:transcriptional regulator with XRE-family HTH domain